MRCKIQFLAKDCVINKLVRSGSTLRQYSNSNYLFSIPWIQYSTGHGLIYDHERKTSVELAAVCMHISHDTITIRVNIHAIKAEKNALNRFNSRDPNRTKGIPTPDTCKSRRPNGACVILNP